MRIPKPKPNHPPEVYEAIIRECGHKPLKMGEHLQACGWALADAAWAAVHWDLQTLATAIANERAGRNSKLTNLSESDFAKLKKEIEADQKPQPSTPRRTPLISKTTPKVPPRPSKRVD